MNIRRLIHKKNAERPANFQAEDQKDTNIKTMVHESFGKISLHGIHFLGDDSLLTHEK